MVNKGAKMMSNNDKNEIPNFSWIVLFGFIVIFIIMLLLRNTYMEKLKNYQYNFKILKTWI